VGFNMLERELEWEKEEINTEFWSETAWKEVDL
jgi:hypothetical protein